MSRCSTRRAGRIDVQGWVTLNNQSGTTFAMPTPCWSRARSAARSSDTAAAIRRRRARLTSRRAGTETAARERLGDFYLYPLPQRTTIAQTQQTKQVSFLDVSGTPARAGLRISQRLARHDRPAGERRIGAELLDARAGRASATRCRRGRCGSIMRDARGHAAIRRRESRIDHTPMGSELALNTGEAFDVKVQPMVTERTRLSSTEPLADGDALHADQRRRRAR